MNRKMIVLICLVVPGISFALSWEETEYRGVTSSGKAVSLEYRTEPSDEDAGHHYFGTSKYSPLAYCDDIGGVSDEEVLRCSATKSGRLTAKYNRAGQNDTRALEALKIYQKKYHMKRDKRYGRNSIDIFVCTDGCKSGVPPILLDISHGD